MCQTSKNAILSVKCQCFATRKQFAELPCGFRNISSVLQNTCFNTVKVGKIQRKIKQFAVRYRILVSINDKYHWIFVWSLLSDVYTSVPLTQCPTFFQKYRLEGTKTFGSAFNHYNKKWLFQHKFVDFGLLYAIILLLNKLLDVNKLKNANPRIYDVEKVKFQLKQYIIH